MTVSVSILLGGWSGKVVSCGMYVGGTEEGYRPGSESCLSVLSPSKSGELLESGVV